MSILVVGSGLSVILIFLWLAPVNTLEAPPAEPPSNLSSRTEGVEVGQLMITWKVKIKTRHIFMQAYTVNTNFEIFWVFKICTLNLLILKFWKSSNFFQQKLPRRYHGVRLASNISYILYYRLLKVSSAPDALWNKVGLHTDNSVCLPNVVDWCNVVFFCMCMSVHNSKR